MYIFLTSAPIAGVAGALCSAEQGSVGHDSRPAGSCCWPKLIQKLVHPTCTHPYTYARYKHKEKILEPGLPICTHAPTH